MRLSLTSSQRLKSKKLIEELFKSGKSINAFPLKLIYLVPEKELDQPKAGFSVSKRNFKKAVDRNRIKRLLREAYRIHRHDYFNNNTTSCAFMILYIGKDKPTFQTVESAMKKLLSELQERLTNSN